MFVRIRPIYFLLPLLCLPFLTMGSQFVGAEHDDALYILGSQALALGNYTQWFLPGSPRFVNGPPGLPALLLPVGFFAPENLFLYQLLMAAVASLAVFFFWKAAHRYFPKLTATTLTAFFAANPVFLYRSGMVMPEIPALAVGLYLWWKQDRISGWAIGTWLLAAYLIRPASVALWGAVWGTLLIQRQWKKGAFSLVLPFVGLILWSAWCHGHGGMQENKELAVFYKGVAGFLKTALTVSASNGKEILLITGQSFLPVFLARDAVALGWGAVLWIISGLGLFIGLRHSSMEPTEILHSNLRVTIQGLCKHRRKPIFFLCCGREATCSCICSGPTGTTDITCYFFRCCSRVWHLPSPNYNRPAPPFPVCFQEKIQGQLADGERIRFGSVPPLCFV
ncbi:MAG: hypothetical protein IPN19_11445 [Elusimicrobia bacterium]|nr:hypothetical protein [Elusimicrobiota bacterium]